MSDTIAAIDLGSNSFHMLVAKPVDGALKVIDQGKEMVRLASGLGPDKTIDDETMQRALACLSRFGQHIGHVASRNVRIVGTNTLRAARNSKTFISEAETLLGHPIEIISGLEEARLIYLGVAHNVAGNKGRRLVVDIGGGSTEIIIGERFEPLLLESLYMGCVSMTRRFFENGKISAKRIAKAETAAKVELEPHAARFKSLPWETSIGASGTARAIDAVTRANGWGETGITPVALNNMLNVLLEAGHIDAIKLPGLKKDRAPVFIGGVIILKTILEMLGIENMIVSDGALREGLLYDLIGRAQQEGTRNNTVKSLLKRYDVDQAHAARVEATAVELLKQVKKTWGLKEEQYEYQLRWAAMLHEIGLSIAHSQHHKHASYILNNADLLGFSREDQQVLAALVQAHRRSFPKGAFKALPNEWRGTTEHLAILLRLAVLLHRSRNTEAVPTPHCEAKENILKLAFAEGWLEAHPLTLADLQNESAWLESAGFQLSYA